MQREDAEVEGVMGEECGCKQQQQQHQHHHQHHHHPQQQQQQQQLQLEHQDGPEVVRKIQDEPGGLVSLNPPELPPRPPHRPPLPNPKQRLRKYVVLCCICGGVASLLGGLFLAVYLILRSYTSSLDYFETIPTYIPAIMLFVTGLGIMCLARRRNRYAILIKICGVSCLACAATCVLVTVTTTVIHMSRLQSLRECVYTIKTQTCTCYSMLLESASERSDDGAHYVFNATPDCEVIHGALYSCLRAMFGLSVIGILVCIFCSMLVYQLLSHERKKMYWEQLELRCRYLYGQPRNQAVVTPQRCNHCACTQQIPYQTEHNVFDTRLWGGGRLGNLYSPNPGEEGGSTGWGWRLPWSSRPPQHPSHSTVPHPSNCCREAVVYHRPLGCSSPDSQYGFNNQGVATVSSATSASYTMIDGNAGCQNGFQWGPPPPYSDPNSPLRRCQPQENYVNTAEVRPARRKCCEGRTTTTSPRNKPRRELTESEVYFADVSSCCNGSVRTDSLVYDEPRDSGPVRHHLRKQPRFVLERNLRLQIQEKEFNKIPEERSSPEALSEVAMDGSDEDPELAAFNQRPEFPSQRPEFPSPMSVSSPSTASKPDFYQSDHSDNSAWGRYSPDFLAPDAQYETIPDQSTDSHRETPDQRFRRNFSREGFTLQPSFDRCGNLTSYTTPSPHYEQIRESSQHYETCERFNDNESSSNSQNINSITPSPKLFEKHKFSQRRTTSLDCVALVDESQCCHTDPSCRCFLNIDNNVNNPEQISPTVI